MFFQAGMHYLSYDEASVYNGKGGYEQGSLFYRHASKYGFHFGFMHMRPLNKKENFRFFFQTMASVSHWERTYTGYDYYFISQPPWYESVHEFQFGTRFELSISVGLFFGLRLWKKG